MKIFKKTFNIQKFWNCWKILKKNSSLSKILTAKNCIENSKNCNNFHAGSKLERIIPNNAKNRGFKVSQSISPFFSTYTSAWPCRFAAGKKCILSRWQHIILSGYICIQLQDWNELQRFAVSLCLLSLTLDSLAVN